MFIAAEGYGGTNLAVAGFGRSGVVATETESGGSTLNPRVKRNLDPKTIRALFPVPSKVPRELEPPGFEGHEGTNDAPPLARVRPIRHVGKETLTVRPLPYLGDDVLKRPAASTKVFDDLMKSYELKQLRALRQQQDDEAAFMLLM